LVDACLVVASCALFDFQLQTVKTKPSRAHLSRELTLLLLCSPSTDSSRRGVVVPAQRLANGGALARISQVHRREGVRAAVIAGQGFAISSRWMFAPELESGEVVPLLTKWRLPAIDLWVLTDPRERLEQSYSPSSGREAMYCR
jgi:DNA-binding transcriptional LysR family regulator